MISDDDLKSQLMNEFKSGNSTETVDRILKGVLKHNQKEFPDLTLEKLQELFIELFLHG